MWLDRLAVSRGVDSRFRGNGGICRLAVERDRPQAPEEVRRGYAHQYPGLEVELEHRVHAGYVPLDGHYLNHDPNGQGGCQHSQCKDAKGVLPGRGPPPAQRDRRGQQQQQEGDGGVAAQRKRDDGCQWQADGERKPQRFAGLCGRAISVPVDSVARGQAGDASE